MRLEAPLQMLEPGSIVRNHNWWWHKPVEEGETCWSAVKRTILLVDDSKTDVELVRRSLSAGPASPHLVVAENGVEALQLLRDPPSRDNPRPDLILLDLNLPCKDGHQVLAEIKDDPALRHIPVVVLTSSNAERDIASAYDLHANCYLTKPMDIDVFAEVLRRIEEFWFSWAKLPNRR